MPPIQSPNLCSILIIVIAFILSLIVRHSYRVDHPATENLFNRMDDGGFLVTPENPAREDGTLDHVRCAALHNKLVEHAWVAEGRPLDELERRSYFQRYGEDANEVRGRLDQSLVSFLESIIVSDELPAFFFWVEDISSPADMFSVQQMFQEFEGEPNRFLTLYNTNLGLGGHSLGLVYDQRLHRATLSLGIEDLDFTKPLEEHGDLWYPLETVLSNWIHMVQIKKITASQDDAPNEKYGPWTWQPYSEIQVDSTVIAFERLATAIEERMATAHHLPSRETEGPLLSDEQLDAASVPSDCFTRSFLTRIRRPRFRMIAPGLEILHDPTAFIANQKFTVMDASSEYGVVIPPVLIFASAERSVVDFDSPNRYVSFNPFCRPFQDGVPRGDRSIIAGLYSESVDRFSVDNAEEGFRLLLPFRFHNLGQGRGARKSDGQPLTDGSVAELFQHGFKPFGGEWWRAQRLEPLFDHWRHLVETRVWTVGNDGVQGGIDVFRDAYTDGSNDYFIRPSW
ncbi:hypothetical protein GGS26DRAFT_560121 [Hypomontagnella submonticulosa]|nr:hypothetical protein GGS26DRAFT_560121 [Hypomontagnella submonticulosa]